MVSCKTEIYTMNIHIIGWSKILFERYFIYIMLHDYIIFDSLWWATVFIHLFTDYNPIINILHFILISVYLFGFILNALVYVNFIFNHI